VLVFLVARADAEDKRIKLKLKLKLPAPRQIAFTWAQPRASVLSKKSTQTHQSLAVESPQAVVVGIY